MSKFKDLIQTHALEVAMLIRQCLKPAYEIERTSYRGSELVMLVREQTKAGVIYYEVIIRPQPYMDPGREISKTSSSELNGEGE